jgi:hypothetical protein
LILFRCLPDQIFVSVDMTNDWNHALRIKGEL